MPGAIYQLNLKGKQDLYLTGKPEFNFIKQVYKRHVNFAIQSFNLIFKNEVDFGRNFDIDIPRAGDFLYKLYFNFTLPPLIKTSGTFAGWTNSIGHAIIDYVDLSIGGHTIDKHYGLYLEIWNELTVKPGRRSAEDQLIGKVDHLSFLETNALIEQKFYVPLKFWFCNNIGSALPLISLQYHSIKLIFKLKPFSDCIVYDGVTPPLPVIIKSPNILADYIFIDETERIKYTGTEHRYLINQVQTIEGESINSGGTHRAFLPFNHPCSELLFVLREDESSDNNDWFNFAQRNTTVYTNVLPLINSAKLILDGTDRTDTLDEKILRIINSHKYHSNTTNKHIYIIPLCNEPEKWYPSGTLNFSLIDSPELHINLKNGINSSKLFIFAKNFNLIYIKEGMIQMGFST